LARFNDFQRVDDGKSSLRHGLDRLLGKYQKIAMETTGPSHRTGDALLLLQGAGSR